MTLRYLVLDALALAASALTITLFLIVAVLVTYGLLRHYVNR